MNMKRAAHTIRTTNKQAMQNHYYTEMEVRIHIKAWARIVLPFQVFSDLAAFCDCFFDTKHWLRLTIMTSWTEIQIIYSWKADQIIFTRNGILVFVIIGITLILLTILFIFHLLQIEMHLLLRKL
jgi:hypothetical protein